MLLNILLFLNSIKVAESKLVKHEIGCTVILTL